MRIVILFLFIATTEFVVAQTAMRSKTNREISYGLFVGGIYSRMSDLPDVIVPQGIYEGYTLEGEGKFASTGGFFINWHYPQAKVGFRTETYYSGQKTDLNYEDVNGLNYKMTFAYHYISVGVHFKYYLLERLYIGLGPYVGFNISSDHINYSSNAKEVFAESGAYFETDENVQKVLRESLTGRNYYYGLLTAGYQFESNLFIGARYTLGLSDALTTEENGHRYSEQKNTINSLSLTVGYSFYFDDLPYFKGRPRH